MIELGLKGLGGTVPKLWMRHWVESTVALKIIQIFKHQTFLPQHDVWIENTRNIAGNIPVYQQHDIW